LARAFINEPKLLLADEPTGNLDEETARKVEQLLFELNEQVGATLLIATHNLDLARKTKRLFRLSHGQLIDEAC
jgi:putative ABC transport system ATP-binding protein